MIKRIVYQKSITVSGQKVQLQIKLPQNVKRLLGLTFTIQPDGLSKAMPFGAEFGWIWLRDAAEMDVFYSDRLIVDANNYNWVSPNLNRSANPTINPVFQSGRFSFHGRKLEHFHFIKKLTSPMIEGYYVDRLQARVTNYTLSIYLKLEI